MFDLLPDFFDKPTGICFEHQEKDEHIEILVRQHWSINLGWMILFTLGLFAPLIFPIVDASLNLNVLNQLPLNIYFGFLIVWFLLLFAYAIENLLYWYFNIYIVTNIHVIDISFQSLLSKHVVEGRLDDIQDVATKVQGLLASFFNYGDVMIETAGKGEQMVFEKVPFPDLISDRIQDLQEVVEPK